MMKNKILLAVFLFISFKVNAQIENPPPPPEIYTPRIFSINDWESPAFHLIRDHHNFPGCIGITDKLEKWRCSFLKKRNFILANMYYPDKAYGENVEGIVIVKYVIEKDGSMTNLNIVRGIGFGCNEEAVRVISRMPHFDIGKARGRPLRETQYAAIEFSKSKNRDNRIRYIERDVVEKIMLEEKDKIYFFEKNLIYPKETFYNATQGIVLVKIYADKKGKQIFEIEHGIDPACDKEALRLVKLMPKYQRKNWKKELNKGTQYVPILFSVYAYELWKNHKRLND